MNLLSATLAEPQSFSPWEKLLLVALIIASGVLFWRRFGPILKRILQSKKDPNFHLAPIGKRVWDFFWEVLCQAKVIRERPLTRPRPCLCLLGILRLRPGHAEPLARRPWPRLPRPARLDRPLLLLLSPQPSPSPAPSESSAFSSADSSSAPAGSATKVSYESGVIALLIFLLMVTYLALLCGHRFQPGGASSLVGPHALPAHFSAHHPPHQAPAPGAQPGHHLSFSRRLQQDSASSRR